MLKAYLIMQFYDDLVEAVYSITMLSNEYKRLEHSPCKELIVNSTTQQEQETK